MVSWGEPRLLLALVLPAAGAAAAWVRHRRRLTDQRRLASPGVWRQVMGAVPATGLLRMLAWSAAAACLVVALARPMWGELPRAADVRTRDVVVAVDVSDSMRCPDLPPSRLAAGLGVVRRALPELAGNRLGVVVFAGDAYPLVPLTIDLEAVATFLDGVEPGMVALPGSNLERAVTESLKLLPEEGTGRVLVLLTDGENLQGEVDAARRRLEEAGVQVVGVVAGTSRGGLIPVPGPGGTAYKRGPDGQPVLTRADRATLERLAGGSGAVVDLAGGDAAHRLAAAVSKVQTRATRASAPVRRVERFPLFLGLAAAFLAVGFLLSPWRRLAAAGLLLALAWTGPGSAQEAAPSVTPPAGTRQAGVTGLAKPPLWQRVLPGGARRLARTGLHRWQAGKREEAARAFAQALSLAPSDPARRYDLGTVLAAGGKLERAAPLLQQAAQDGRLGASAAYNLGTAALMAGQAQPAVQWLRRALLVDPADPHVKRNYELALRLLEQQKKQRNTKNREQKDRSQEQRQQEKKERRPQGAGPTPTPKPTPSAQPLYGALERAEREARKRLARPTPAPVRVEKDW